MPRHPWLRLIPCVLAAGLLSAHRASPPVTVSSFTVHRTKNKLSGNQVTGTIELRVLAAPAAPRVPTITVSRSVVTAGFGTVTTSATTNVVVAP